MNLVTAIVILHIGNQIPQVLPDAFADNWAFLSESDDGDTEISDTVDLLKEAADIFDMEISGPKSWTYSTQPAIAKKIGQLTD